ncbi:hypothetical protein AMJ44_04410, partial [candidate division WOR-1 bacterium DG_54_3]
MGIQHLNGQELNVALNQGAQALDMTSQESLDKTLEKKQSSKNILEKLFSGKKLDRKGTAVLVRDTMVKMQGMGLNLPTKNILSRVNNENERLLGKGEDRGDEVVLSQKVVQDAIKGIGSRRNKSGNQGNNPDQGIKTYSTDAEVKELVQEYSSLFLEGLVKSDPRISERLKTIREKLLEKGVSLEDLKSIELSIKKELRGKIVSELRDRFLAAHLAQGKAEHFMAKGSITHLI